MKANSKGPRAAGMPVVGERRPGVEAGRRARAIGALVLLLLPVSLLRLAWPLSPGPSPPGSAASLRPLKLHSRSAEAWYAAQQSWMQATETTSREIERMDEWDPEAMTGAKDSQLGCELMVRSPDLQRAHRLALRAAALAQNNEEAFRAVRLLALLECSMGRHRDELRRARQLVALAPRDEVALMWLRRAARCNHLKGLEQRADAALNALRQAPRDAPPIVKATESG